MGLCPEVTPGGTLGIICGAPGLAACKASALTSLLSLQPSYVEF